MSTSFPGLCFGSVVGRYFNCLARNMCQIPLRTILAGECLETYPFFTRDEEEVAEDWQDQISNFMAEKNAANLTIVLKSETFIYCNTLTPTIAPRIRKGRKVRLIIND